MTTRTVYYKFQAENNQSEVVVQSATLLHICSFRKDVIEKIFGIFEKLLRSGIESAKINIVPEGTVIEKKFRLISPTEIEITISDQNLRLDFTQFTVKTDEKNLGGFCEPKKLYTSLAGTALSIMYIFQKGLIPNMLPGEGKLMYRFGIYKDYMIQLKEFTESLRTKYPLVFSPNNAPKQLFQHHAICLVRHIMSMDIGDKASHPDANAKFLNLLRRLLNPRNYAEQAQKYVSADPMTQQVRDFADEIVMWIFTKADLHTSQKKVFHRLISKHHDLGIDLETSVLNTNDKITDFPKCTLPLPRRTDYYTVGNLPHQLFTLKCGNKTTAFIHTPSVFLLRDIDQYLNTPLEERGKLVEIIPEASRFLDILDREGKRLLWINTMMHHDDPNKNIHEHSFRRVFYEMLSSKNSATYLGVNRNSSLYASSDGYSDEIDNNMQQWNYFIATLMDVWSGKTYSSCDFDERKGKDLDLLKVNLMILLNDVKTHYFPELKTISNQDRIIFQELAFIEMIDQELLDGYDFLAVSCFSTFDRGPSLYNLLRLKYILKERSELTPEDLLDLVHGLFVHSFFVEERNPAIERLGGFLLAADIMMKRGPMVPKEKLKSLLPGNTSG